MRIGPKYKIARRLGAPIFEKTQTAKYTLSLARKERNGMTRSKPKSEYGLQLLEKQKARLSYGLSERQFRIYVDKSMNVDSPVQKLFSLLEKRLDNVLYRAGFASTRSAARQMASHGHMTVNGRRVNVPSLALNVGDLVAIRAGSAESSQFLGVAERIKAMSIPEWLKADVLKRTVEVTGEPHYERGEQVFDLGVVIEFYNR